MRDWERENALVWWSPVVWNFEKNLTSVRDNWNKLDRWERMVRVGGFGKWESEFQEGSMILITQNVGFIYKKCH